MDSAQPHTPAEAGTLTSYLQQLHAAAGHPSLRRIATATGIGHTRVHDYLRGAGHAAPWDRMATLVAYLDGDAVVARELWRQERTQRAAEREARAAGQHEAGTVVDLLSQILDELRALRQVTERLAGGSGDAEGMDGPNG
jgi:hypothetical protein